MMRNALRVFLCLGMCCAGNSWAAGFEDAAPLGTARYLHTATLLSNGRVLVAGGTTDGTNFLSSAEVYDPASNTWSGTANNLSAARGYHTATLLPNGKVLVAGGYDGSVDLDTAELYDPASNTWSAAGDPIGTRAGHTATLLPSGKVLVTGGHNPIVLDTAEVYDPASDTWSATANNLSTPRIFHTATLLPNGQVLVAGGTPDLTGATASSDLYNPATNMWSATGSLNTARYNHAAILLASGNVLAMGGDNGPTASVEQFVTSAWSARANLPGGIRNFTATLLADGTVFVNGGYDGSFAQSTASVYDPVGNSWSPAGPGNLANARRFHTSTLLPSGQVLIVGGDDGSGMPINSVEIFDPTSGGTWGAAANLGATRAYHTATLLPSGKVLVAGGYNPTPLSSAVVYDPGLNTWSAAGTLGAARYSHTATLLPNGKVLVVGGSNGASLNSAELYDPGTNMWSAAGSLAAARATHTATLLPNGKVLVAGGFDSGYLISAEVYDPALNIWSAAGTLGTARANHTATLLPNGKVLVAAGDSLNNAELYDPALNTWSAAGSLSGARGFHTATLLPNGHVLVAGGYYGGGYLSTAEVYNPASDTWTATTNTLSSARDRHTATLLLNGKVLVAGGYLSGASISSAEVYDPLSDKWNAAGSLGTAREFYTATLLPTGKVLAAGGINGAAINSAELYDTGLGFTPAWQPTITFTRSPLRIGADTLMLTGTGFKGISEASGGGSNNSATNYPVVQLRSLVNEQTVFLPSPSWSDTGFTSALIPPFPIGFAMVTVFTNGIPGNSTFTQILSSVIPPVINSPLTASGTAGAAFTYTITATNTPTSFGAFNLPANLTLDTATGIITGTPTAVGNTNVTITATNAGGTDVKTLVLTVINLPPVIISFASQQTPAISGAPITFLLTATDLDTANLMYGINFGDGSNMSGTMAAGATATITHTYTVGGSFSVTASVSDGQTAVSANTPQDVFAPDSGGDGVTNVSNGLPPVANPLNGISIEVDNSNGGVVQLGIDINAVIKDVFVASTEFGDIPGHSTTVEGMSPVHQFVQHGIFVAKTSAINTTTTTTAGIARKTITVGSKETGEAANLPDRLGDPPSNSITVKSIKSKFSFKGSSNSSARATSSDTVIFSGSILLPAGLNPAKSHEMSIGIGNIIVNTMLDAHGKGTSTGGPNILKSLKVTYKNVKKGAVTLGGETAQFTLSFSTTGIVAAGFDTEGISNRSTDIAPGRSGQRSIQLALLLDGTPYEFQAGVTFTMSKDSAFGTISGRSAK